MATYGWGSDRTVADWLFAEGYRFDFYQAVKLLELLRPDATPVAEGSEPAKEPVRFASAVDLAFPASEVAAVRHQGEDGHPPVLTVNFLGLAGARGPLPPVISELILERLRARDTAMRDFLDIFNHRLVSLLHRVRKTHRVGLTPTPPGQDPLSHCLFALFGMRTPGVRGRMQVRDRALLGYTGLLAQQPRSAVGLEAVLQDYFRIPVRVEQFCGQWIILDAEQVTTIGMSGQNQGLGRGAVLGTRVWDQESAFTLHLGPLTLPAFLDMLPIGRGFLSVCELTRLYVGPVLDFDLQLTVKAAEVPASRLSAVSGPLLGWTSWLKTQEFSEDASPVRLTTPAGGSKM